MKFKINLNPYPGSPYFTVQEHLRKFGIKEDPAGHLSNAESQLRTLFNIPEGFSFEILNLSDKDKFCSQFESFIIKDDPLLGIDRLTMDSQSSTGTKILDLSYSFPQIPNDFFGIDTIIIDPNASLGIHTDLLLVFHMDDSISSNGLMSPASPEPFIKDIYVLSRVADDLIEKGREMLVRESNYKAAVLYHLIENHKYFKPIVEKNMRSKTIISARCDLQLLRKIQQMGYEITSRIDEGNAIITIANYPTHSKELVEMFADRIMLL